MGIIKKLNFLLEHTLLTLYFSLFHSVISYGIIIWGSFSKSFLNQILVVQKKTIRVICGKDRYFHTKPLFLRLNILNFFDLFNYSVCIHLFKILVLDKYINLKYLILQNNVDHNYNTRISFLRLPFYSKSLCQRSLIYIGPKLWNLLLNFIKSIRLYHLLKGNLKFIFWFSICKFTFFQIFSLLWINAEWSCCCNTLVF